jgi:hypothetical protein
MQQLDSLAVTITGTTLSRALLVALLATFLVGHARGQSVCGCLASGSDESVLMKESVRCDTTFLKNRSLLYYQFNCDSIWLTLEDVRGRRKILFSMDAAMYGYTYRLGYQLMKEFSSSLLFRHGCPANGPCDYSLLDKETGKKIMGFGDLIYDGHDTLSDFIVYFTSYSHASITLHFINTGKKHLFKVNPARFSSGEYLVPEQQFYTVSVSQNSLELKHRFKLKDEDEDWSIDSLVIDLAAIRGSNGRNQRRRSVR